jgi:hypothetical protein
MSSQLRAQALRAASRPVACAAFLFLAASVSAQPKAPSGPWKDIFNKKDLTGWASVGNPPWSITGGVLQTKGGATKTYLIWKEPLKDMELEVKYRLSTTNANSGIQVRSNCADKTKSLPDCGGTYQVCGVQLDVAQSYSGRLFEECVGFLQFDGQNIDNCRRTLAVGQWMTTQARFDGAKVSVWLNGTHCLDYTLTNAEHLTGSIFALQSHPPFDLIEWDAVRIRKINVKGCTNPKATNYNPEATNDDGSCVVPSALAQRAPAPRRDVSALETPEGAALAWDIADRGTATVTLHDAWGKTLSTRTVAAPGMGLLPLPGRGIYFVEIESAGRLTRHRIHRF